MNRIEQLELEKDKLVNDCINLKNYIRYLERKQGDDEIKDYVRRIKNLEKRVENIAQTFEQWVIQTKYNIH